MTTPGLPEFSSWIQHQAKLTSAWAEGIRHFVSGAAAGGAQTGSTPGPDRQREGGTSDQPWLQELQALWRTWAEIASGAQESALQAFTVGAEGGPHRAAEELVHSTVGKLLGSPGLGYTREFQEKSADAFAAWSELWKAQTEYSAELVHAAERSWELFEAKLAERKREGEGVEKWGELLELWSEAAEQGYFAVAATPEFVRAQAHMTNTAMRYRIRSRELADEFYRAAGLPTSGDVQESFRSLHEVRGRLRTLEREVEDLRAELARGSSGAPEAPGGRAPRQRRNPKTPKRRQSSGAKPGEG